jgi:hypothetical protein
MTKALIRGTGVTVWHIVVWNLAFARKFQGYISAAGLEMEGGLSGLVLHLQKPIE